MATIRITGVMEVDDELVDKNHSTGLTQLGYEAVRRMFGSLDDIETELEEDDEPEPEERKRKPKVVGTPEKGAFESSVGM